MDPINSVVKDLKLSLQNEEDAFINSQSIHFDWLKSVSFQLNLFNDNEVNIFQSSTSDIKNNTKSYGKLLTPHKSDLGIDIKKIPPLIEEIPSPLLTTSCILGSIPNGSNLRFVVDEDLISEYTTDSESLGDEAPENEAESRFTLSGNLKELTASTSSFRSQWIEMVNEKEAEIPVFIQPQILLNEEEEIPDCYQMSDSDYDSYNDEIYERNPIEIHGKLVPLWARPENLDKALRKQQRLNPDKIFIGFRKSCRLEEVFNRSKPEWHQRSDSIFPDMAQELVC